MNEPKLTEQDWRQIQKLEDKIKSIQRGDGGYTRRDVAINQCRHDQGLIREAARRK